MGYIATWQNWLLRKECQARAELSWIVEEEYRYRLFEYAKQDKER